MLNNDQALRAARQGRTLHKYLDAVTVTGSYVVSTNTAIYYDIPAGKQVVIRNIFAGCETVDEECAAYLVGCSAVAGGGDATQLEHHFHTWNGAKKEGVTHHEEVMDPPLVVKYSDGHRSVSVAVKATDTNTVVSYGWCGWMEDEGTLS